MAAHRYLRLHTGGRISRPDPVRSRCRGVVPPQRTLDLSADARPDGTASLASGRRSAAAPNFRGADERRGIVKRSPLEIATVRPVKHFDLRLATCTAQTPDIATWEQQLRATERSAANGRKALAANRQWWKNFWDKSFIFVETPDIDTGFRITQSYLLQSWMPACGGRGAYPIKFNGGIFTVDPVFTDTKIRRMPITATGAATTGGEYPADVLPNARLGRF